MRSPSPSYRYIGLEGSHAASPGHAAEGRGTLRLRLLHACAARVLRFRAAAAGVGRPNTTN